MKKIINYSIKSEALSWFILGVVAIVSIYFYTHFPAVVPTHWGINGEVDAWSSRAIGAFLFPGIIIFTYSIFLFLPMLDPKKERYEQFEKVYGVFKNTIIVFMAIAYFITGLYALGYNIAVGRIMPMMIGVLFIILGNYMGKLKSNWFVGIKTPWTLSSEDVWNKTHNFGGKVFVISGLIIFFMDWYPVSVRLYIFIATIILLVFGTFAYSYYLFIKEKKHGKNDNELPK